MTDFLESPNDSLHKYYIVESREISSHGNCILRPKTMAFSGLTIWGIVVAANQSVSEATVPPTTTTTESPIPNAIELTGELNFNRDFEILGKYNLIGYTVDNAPVYEQSTNSFLYQNIYVYYECGEWNITPYYTPGVQQCPLRWLWKKSSGKSKKKHEHYNYKIIDYYVIDIPKMVINMSNLAYKA